MAGRATARAAARAKEAGASPGLSALAKAGSRRQRSGGGAPRADVVRAEALLSSLEFKVTRCARRLEVPRRGVAVGVGAAAESAGGAAVAALRWR